MIKIIMHLLFHKRQDKDIIIRKRVRMKECLLNERKRPKFKKDSLF